MTEMALPSSLPGEADEADIGRRKFLTVATISLAVTGAAMAAVPFIESWLPSERARALGGPVDVDVSKIGAGGMIVVLWRKQPTFVLHRMQAQLDSLEDASHQNDLRDPDSAVLQQPTYAKNWHRSVKPEYLIAVGVCTHLGCMPRLQLAPDASLGPTWRGGYVCPCHGSRYDLAARVFKDVPAPYNLPIPPHHFLNSSMLRIGENPPGFDFDFDSIVQV